MIATEHAKMVNTLAKPGAEILDSMTATRAELLHMAIGMSGEAGELMEGIYGNDVGSSDEFDIDNIMEELGDYHFYFVGLTDLLAINRERYIDDVEMSATSLSPVRLRSSVDTLVISTAHALDKVKKLVIYNKGYDSLRVLDNNIAHDIGRIGHALFIIRKYFGFTLDDVLNDNIAKLTKGKDGKPARYEGGVYSDKAAQERADKA